MRDRPIQTSGAGHNGQTALICQAATCTLSDEPDEARSPTSSRPGSRTTNRPSTTRSTSPCTSSDELHSAVHAHSQRDAGLAAVDSAHRPTSTLHGPCVSRPCAGQRTSSDSSATGAPATSSTQPESPPADLGAGQGWNLEAPFSHSAVRRRQGAVSSVLSGGKACGPENEPGPRMTSPWSRSSRR